MQWGTDIVSTQKTSLANQIWYFDLDGKLSLFMAASGTGIQGVRSHDCLSREWSFGCQNLKRIGSGI